MEILKATLDKMRLSFKRFTTFFLVFSIAFPVAFIVTLMYRNSSFGSYEGFLKLNGNVQGSAENVTTELLSIGLRGRVQNISDENLGRRGNNYTVSEVLQGKTQNGTATAFERRADNIIASDHVGSKKGSLTSSTNDSNPHTGNSDDKLLDGLVASGFDEASCISRRQSQSCRKASPHKPSPYLISKLRNYEEIHTRCGPNSRAYNRNMIKIIRSKYHGHGAGVMCKYLVWTPANGLGNQMVSLAATFLYAVLTDRVLLVKFGKDKHGLFCEPFLNSTWILPNNSPFWNPGLLVETYQSMLEKDRANNSKEDLPSAVFLNLQHTLNNPEKFFHCDHSQQLLRKVPVLILRSDQYFVPSLLMIPSFTLEIDKMFPEKDTIFHQLGRYLFHPSNEVWGLISRFYQTYLARADERIGLQIRVFNHASTPQQTVMDLILSCTIKQKILPEVDVRNSMAASTRRNQTTKAVLVASLYPEYGENLRTMYLKNPTVTGEIIGVYQPSHEENQKFNDNMQNKKAWMEMYLLSLCDVLVTTSLSTFGYVAQGLGGLKPWLLYRLVQNETHFPMCERDLSLEPCYHVPPKHFCNGNPIKDFVPSFPYMRECKDYCFGVKLVNGSK